MLVLLPIPFACERGKGHFRSGPATDTIYMKTRDGIEEDLARGREYIERMWQEVAPFVDCDAAARATRDLTSVFWVLQLAYTVKSNGKTLMERGRLGYENNKGPDLFAEDDPGIWMEAVAVGRGTGPDALKRYEAKEPVYNYDPDPVVLRLRSVIKDKSEKIQSYITDGIIKPSQATVIAISGVSLPPHCSSGIYPPEIVRAVYPVNNQVLQLNRETMAVTDSHFEYRDRVYKKNGADVATDIFMDPNFSHISAVLFGESGWVYPLIPPGAEFKLVHNSMEATPLPDGWFPGDKYWWRDGERHWTLERRRNTDVSR